ncbi:MAG: hypothetical protein RJB34_205 [Pseudomonadota bacterium]|jgi:hypothetical protein
MCLEYFRKTALEVNYFKCFKQPVSLLGLLLVCVLQSGLELP